MPRGPKPKPDAKRPEQRQHQVTAAAVGGWQHGDVPDAPAGLQDVTLETWRSWFGSWWSSFWTVDDVPQLRQVIGLVDEVNRGKVDLLKAQPVLDRWGLSPKGRQDLRWAPPKGEADVEVPVDDEVAKRRQARDKKLA